MCGFFCIIGKNISKIVSDKEILTVGKKYIHRGPDSQKYYFENEFKCYFRRLSIIDINERSDQPFTSQDGRYLMLFNGEIYNFKVLKKELINLGQKFRTEGDTEVLIKAFQVWGKKFVKRIRGMFSICIWDKKLKRFYSFRDRFGIKPLYYTFFKGIYIFSSEIKDIILLLKKKKIFNENKSVVNRYLSSSFLDDTEQSFYKDIKSVQPANIIEISNLQIKFEKYWSLKHSEKNHLKKDEIIKNFKKMFDMHTISDVPVAYTLSGGIDSSLIAGVSTKIKNFDRMAKFFSIRPNKTFDETFWINSTVKKFDLNHYFLNSKKGNFKDFSKFLNFQDEPVQSASAYYQFQLRKKIKQEKIKVLMVGEGADEVYGGYKRCLYYYLNFMNFNKTRLLNFLGLSSEFMQNDIKNILENYINFKKKIENKQSDIEDHTSKIFLKSKCKNKNFLEIPKNSKNFFKDALISHMTKRDLPYVLRMEDRNSMSQSIEARVPFLDHEIVEYIYNIKSRYFMKNAENKHILRNCFKNFLSKEVLNRKHKSPRPGNNSEFIFNDFYENFIELLNYNLTNDYFDSNIIKFNLEKDKKNKSFINSNFYFRIFNYLVWRENSMIKI